MISAKELYSYSKGLDLLFVEDDEPLRVQMGAMCEELFDYVEVAENGKVGLEQYNKRLQEGKRAFDLVITDINMPVMNGIEMIRHIYETHPLQPILVISAHNESDYLVQLLDIGIDSFLIKPMRHEKIIHTLHKITQNIVNKQLLKEHYEKIDRLNAELSMQKQQLLENNDALKEKNIALEKSMRIIEGMQHKDRLQRNIHTPYISVRDSIPKDTQLPDSHPSPAGEKLLKEIEEIISDIILESHYKGLKEELLHTLNTKIKHYASTLEKPSYKPLKASLTQLSDAVAKRPGCTNMDELERIFNMLESFFFIYGRWQKELEHINDNDFETFSDSISSEIKTLIDVWQCKV